VRLRQLLLELINCVRRQPGAVGKVECLEVPEILEPVDVGQLGAGVKVECLDVPEIILLGLIAAFLVLPQSEKKMRL
jgi:hypothetical protein